MQHEVHLGMHKRAPRAPQDHPKIAPRRPRTIPRRSKVAPRRPKTTQRPPQDISKSLGFHWFPSVTRRLFTRPFFDRILTVFACPKWLFLGAKIAPRRPKNDKTTELQIQACNPKAALEPAIRRTHSPNRGIRRRNKKSIDR